MATIQVTRISREVQPINRIRVDFRSNQRCVEHCQQLLTSSSIAYNIRPSPTNHLLDQTDAFDAIRSSVTKLPTVLMTRNASSAATIMNTIETVRILSSVPIIVGQTWLVRQSVQLRPVTVERSGNNKRGEEGDSSKTPRPFTSFSCYRLYSSVLQTVAPHAHPAAKKRKFPQDRSTDELAQPSIIINTLKAEIERSQKILLNCITQLASKCDVVQAEQAAFAMHARQQ